MDARTPDTENHELELDKALNGFAKALYITDTDKRKSFALHVKLFHLSGHDHGTFRSKPIKVRLLGKAERAKTVLFVRLMTRVEGFVLKL